MIAYALTDPSTLNFNTLESDLEHFAANADMIVYRDKSSQVYSANAKLFIEQAREYSFKKILLHTDYKLAYQLKADGIHLKSTQFEDIPKAKALGLWVVISTHTRQEALEAQALKADMVTYSPIFKTPNKGKPKGLEALNKVSSTLSIPVIALGGILTQEQVTLCEQNGAGGFASIRYFG